MAPKLPLQSLSARRGDRTRKKPKVGLLKLLVGFSFILLCGMQWVYRRVILASSKSLNHKKSAASFASDASSKSAVVDLLSIGSNLQQNLQDAQRSTMGRHPAVRYFVGVNETIDTEQDCHSRLTMDHIRFIVHHCTQLQPKQKEDYPIWTKIRASYARLRWLEKKANPPGWMCAQKRPIDAFMYYIRPFMDQQEDHPTGQHKQSTNSATTLPDYLIVMDDDTWMALDHVLPFLQNNYPPDGPPHAIAGCMIRSNVYQHSFTIPFGGYGIIFNRAALRRWIQPLHCQTYERDDGFRNQTNPPTESFEKLACWRLAQSPIGERPLFREGMSIAQLMQAYTTDQPYLNVKRWNHVGFCMHSDWVWGYFVNYYHIAVHTTHEPYYANVLQDRLVGYNYSQIYAGGKTRKTTALLRECNHKMDDKCDAQAHICHRVSITHMNQLFVAQTSRMRRQHV